MQHTYDLIDGYHSLAFINFAYKAVNLGDRFDMIVHILENLTNYETRAEIM